MNPVSAVWAQKTNSDSVPFLNAYDLGNIFTKVALT